MIQIGITGHMNLKKACIPYYRDALLHMLQELKEKYSDILIYSALADGADRLIVEVAIELHIAYIAVLPMPKADYCLDFTEASCRAFDILLEGALEIVEMPLLSHMLKERALQYEASGIYIANRCDILIALWNGKHTRLTGGTGEIVKYYTSKQSYRLYHLPVSRESDLTNNMIEFNLYEKQ